MRYAVATLALLAACSSAPPEVDWDDHPAGTKERIDLTADAKGCDFLEAERENAEKADDGEDLVDYIDAKMKAAGCD